MGDAPSSARRGLLAGAALSAALSPLNSTMLSVALGPIGEAFDADASTLTGGLVTSYLVTSIVIQAPGGALADRIGHRGTLVLGQLGFAVAAALAVFAPALPWLVVARVAMAAAGALIVPSAIALVRTELPPEVRGRAFGLFGASMSLAAALGPLVGGQLAVAFGWRSLFALNLVVLPIAFALIGRGHARRDAVPRSRAPFDWLGSSLLAVALGALVLGAGRRGLDVPLLVTSPLVLALFVLVERRARAPVVDLALLRSRVFAGGGLLIALHNLAMYALLFELPSVCAALLGTSAAESGGLLVAILAPMVVGSPLGGRLADAYGARRVAFVGASLALVGLVVVWLTPLSSVTSPIPGLIALGAGLALSSAPAQSAAMSAASASASGVAAGMMSTLRYLGGVVGTLLLGVFAAPPSDRGAVLASHHTLLGIFSCASALALACALALPQRALSRSGR